MTHAFKNSSHFILNFEIHFPWVSEASWLTSNLVYEFWHQTVFHCGLVSMLLSTHFIKSFFFSPTGRFLLLNAGISLDYTMCFCLIIERNFRSAPIRPFMWSQCLVFPSSTFSLHLFQPLQPHLRLDFVPKSLKISTNFLACHFTVCYRKHKEYQKEVCDYRSFLHFV